MKLIKIISIFVFFFIAFNINAEGFKNSFSVDLEDEYLYRLMDRASSISPSRYFTNNFKPYSERELLVMLNNDKRMKDIFVVDGDIEDLSRKIEQFYKFKYKKEGLMDNLLGKINLTMRYKNEDDEQFSNTLGSEYKGTNYNVALKLDGGVNFGDLILFSYTLSLENNENDNLDVGIYKFNLKKGFRHITVIAGKDNVVVGPGYFGNLLFSKNIEPEMMLMFKTEIPYDTFIGAIRWYLWNMWIDDNDRANTDPKLLGMRLSLMPFDWLELAGTRAIYYGGSGNPSYSSVNDYWKLFTAEDENTGNKWDTDQYFGVDVSLYLPILKKTGFLKGGKLYTEYSWTDITAPWQKEDKGKDFQLLGASYIHGLYLTTGNTDFRFEYTKISHVNYNNHNFGTDGYTDEGYLIGHYAGRDSKSYFAEIYDEITDKLHFYIGGGIIKRGLNMKTQQYVKEGYVGGRYLWSKAVQLGVKISYSSESKIDINPSPVYYTFSDESRDILKVYTEVDYRF
ncbi:MAG: hypothetical protein JG767_1734 [Deferribacteraceae bacterium]|jgi:hypothetical protein|nr:hypothetical protein [Deferribacteraceae bacterium]